MDSIAQRVRDIKNELSKGNSYGEPVLLVGAIKMQSVQDINQAVEAGLDAVAENKAQEFRDKNDAILPCPRHFIGHLQTNKVKYLVGKVQLFHSCDRDELASEIARLSVNKGLVSNVLIQVNIGDEQTKGGYAYEQAEVAVEKLSKTQGLCVKGLMAMLPDSNDETILRALARKMRALYNKLKEKYPQMQYLSMGMSGDYRLCIEEGSNVVRLGSTIFGARDYTNKA